MERIALTPEQQTAIDAWIADKANDTLNPMTPDLPGTNLVSMDHVRICDSFNAVILGAGNGAPYVYIPDWDMWLNLDCVDYITDRIGPTGATMPIIDPPPQI